MHVQDQPAFILHARPYRETSLLLDCFTRDYGRIGLVARGVRRERSRLPRGLLQSLQPLLLSWGGRGELATLINVDSYVKPHSLKGDALFAAMYINELVLRITERQDPHPHAFTAYTHCLNRLASDEPQAWTLRRFERDLLAELGYGLILEHEGTSGTKLQPDEDYAYEPETGPLRWNNKSQAIRISGTALLALGRDEIPDTERLSELRRLMRSLIRHHLGADLKAWGLVFRSSGMSRL